MKPESKSLERIWDVLIAISAILTALYIPARLVLNLHDYDFFIYIDWSVTAVFSIDIFFRLRSLKQGHELEFDLARYRPHWFVVDFIAAIPLHAFFATTPLQLFRLLKLARVAQSLRQLRQRDVRHSNALRLVFFMFWLFLSLHWIACGWLALRGASVGSDNWTTYLNSLYWCVTTITTVGYGDVTPSTNVQTLYSIAIMLLGVGVYGYIIGSITSIFAKKDPAEVHYQENMDKLTAFMKYRNIPSSLRLRIREYYRYLWEKRLGYDESTVMTSLPPSLRAEISLYFIRDIIEKVPMFRGANDAFMREMALRLRPVVFTPGDYVFKAGEHGGEMYFVSRGTLEVISKDGKTILATLTDGDFFGEIALLRNQLRTASVRAVDYCDLYLLDKETFGRILAHYPDIAAQIESLATLRQERGM
jgi:voltage-gated potassium channel